MTDSSQEPWHSKTSEAVLKSLGSESTRGLTVEQAQHSLAQFGLNRLAVTKSISPFAVFLGQFKNILVIILLLGVALSGFLGHAVEAIAIGVIVLFAVILGFVQEFRAEKAMEALKKMAAPIATILRGGQEVEILAEEIVPGDILVLGAGDRIAADARIIESVNMKAEEASLTGESVPVEKHSEAIAARDAALGDRKNMVFASTNISYGRGLAVVVATGMNTEIGKIAGMLQEVVSMVTPLQKNLAVVGKRLAQAAFVIVAVIVGVGLFRGSPLVEILLFGVALAVAVVPEALPAVVTISLSIGVQRMVKRNALVRRLPAVETLGATTVICTDKTGTLTKDEMTVRKIYLPGRPIIDVTGAGYEPEGDFLASDKPVLVEGGFLEFLKAGALCSDAHLIENEAKQWDIKGDPTEGALVVAAAKAGLIKTELDSEYSRVAEIPFSSEDKFMATAHKTSDYEIQYAKGAAEIVLGFCTQIATGSGFSPLTDDYRRMIQNQVEDFSKLALRVIAIASKESGALGTKPSELVFLGLAAMIDPPRLEAAEAIATSRAAGIKVMMITGDHPITAEAIARELGLINATGVVVTGPELEKMSALELENKIESVDVCARVSPEHKLRVVTALQARGHVVAMTGDGVNDAPALKKADIGIAMGITGTDVAKEAADMLLLDDNFASIVAAIEEGRIIFGNIKKYLTYLLSSNIGEIGIMVGATVIGLPLPLTAVQILYVNLATDGLPALALAVDPPRKNLMSEKPRNLKTGIFTKPVVALMLTGGVWSMVINIALFIFLLGQGRPESEVMTIIFVNLVLVEFIKAYAFRSESITMFRNFFSNKWLNRAVLWELLLLGAVVYWPILHKPFNTFSLALNDYFIILPVALTVVIVLEIAKVLISRLLSRRQARA
ncbi:MAG: cation-translocating P-type ATPase [Candidatus Magasanikbacteria bacterium]|nr:cation-translocating P-type ATPase [Candidatus Magasanikbacteria bacterium]